MKLLDSSLKYSKETVVNKVFNHPEVKKYFGKEIKITQKDIERAKYLGASIDTKIKELPPNFPKFSSKYI